MNILLIDDHSMFAESLARSLIKYDVISDVEIITNLDESMRLLAEKIISLKFDIVLMDINLTKTSDLDGFDLAEEILALDKNSRIIMLTAFDMPMYIEKARGIGARAFVSKDDSTDRLVEIIERVMDDHTYFTGLNDLDTLTDREVEIVRLYCSGKSRKEIAAECYMSISSLATALIRIYSKLGINNYQDLYKRALELGYLKIDFI